MIKVILTEKSKETDTKNSSRIFIEHNVFNKWKDYKDFAITLVKTHKNQREIIIIRKENDISFEKLALAIFIASTIIPNNLESAIFEVDDFQKARKSYNPYIAITVAIKYILNLSEKNIDEIYKDISGLGYLGIDVKRKFLDNTITLKLTRNSEHSYKYQTVTLKETLEKVAILKALSLTDKDISMELEILCNPNNSNLDTDNIIDKVVENMLNLI